MYQKDDFIMYGSTGVCRVESVGPMEGSKDTSREYYTLAPVFGRGVIYTPVDTSVFMRPVLSPEEVDALIDLLPELPDRVEGLTNLRLLSEYCRAVLDGHRSEDLLSLIKILHRRSVESERMGRRLGLTEMKYRKLAEELIHGEFAVALGIALEEVPEYISQRLSGEQAEELDYVGVRA